MLKHNSSVILDNRSLALHLIKEDLKYHQMVAQCAAVEVHIEFFPDMATVVKALLDQEEGGDGWEDKYVMAMKKAEQLSWGDAGAVEALAIEVIGELGKW